MPTTVTDRDIDALLTWLLTSTHDGELEWMEPSPQSFVLCGETGTLVLTGKARACDGVGAGTSEVTLHLRSPLGVNYRYVRASRAEISSSDSSVAGRSTRLFELFDTVRGRIEPEDPTFDLVDFIRGF